MRLLGRKIKAPRELSGALVGCDKIGYSQLTAPSVDWLGLGKCYQHFPGPINLILRLLLLLLFHDLLNIPLEYMDHLTIQGSIILLGKLF